ncbi:bifunctional proline dehydrogenase/L-glutamate gamma-semialdehyde dehydrogenase PutA [Marinobacter sp. CHS3-4]|uniref:bifunctional proline dehydrogenase/L-glutamate gamma-semialdehyde dehydrogenase PutA n=1 Tax=Marinobacter sp. CHS3-4 TaxID=3045174 RepID=UPI0024B4CAFD|nr:bifunctional proline dehydrogenase/L-glutamate gamma-semialdehyde dehydrogenase PutA [Marinobacter sp. CHS3-4]MDI9245797.1 bifunctional proline dehydrogenase/L-glutamate gamma-semialdehyde dehydrogenase PutA [Marinobacter sp. CHS3-4]
MFEAARALEPVFQEQSKTFFWHGMLENYAVDEEAYLRELMVLAESNAAEQKATAETAADLIRLAPDQSPELLSQQFVLGQDIGKALENAGECLRKGCSYSFDMLAESAVTASDAARHFARYEEAILTAGPQSRWGKKTRPLSVSLKLSALHPRFDVSQQERVFADLYPILCDLVACARGQGVAITLDAEDMDRFELTLQLFEKVYYSPVAEGWNGLGVAIQAYSKRALPALCWLNKLAKEQGDEIPVRLVKGAYWDAEIKHAQQLGISSYPVFTRKEGTDTSYLACLRFLLSDYTKGGLFPQLATHNAHTVASVLVMSSSKDRRLELQRLHGMGDALYDSILKRFDYPVRIYAPVGGHEELPPYLVRRLLENGASTSFVHRLAGSETPVEVLTKDPVQELGTYPSLGNDLIPLPPLLYGSERTNAKGWNLAITADREKFVAGLRQWWGHEWQAGPIIGGKTFLGGCSEAVLSPNNGEPIGERFGLELENLESALEQALCGFVGWCDCPAAERADAVQGFADAIEAHRCELVALCSQETGLPIRSVIEDLRNTVDLCRYYASQSRSRFGHSVALPGPTGETNELYMEGRGVFLCVSPAGSPMSVFCGQIVAALLAGNTVLAESSGQSSLLAHRLVELMLAAGIPENAIHLLPGHRDFVGSTLVPDPRIAGVTFTGSAQVARRINRLLAEREGACAPLVAEIGGQNAMIADSSAVPEQVVRDALESAFSSAGQGCSALRVLFLPEDIADQTERLIAGALNDVCVGNSTRLSTDVGPMVDADAKSRFERYLEVLERDARLIGKSPMPVVDAAGHFVAPSAWEIKSLKYLKNECFGPILHVIRYRSDDLDGVINQINSLGNGLTLGIQSRSESTAAYIEKRVRAGNTYINRDQAAAVAGVQPCGGEGLSGADPKAGGPNYLLRFAAERTRTINTTAMGGNASLLSLGI